MRFLTSCLWLLSTPLLLACGDAGEASEPSLSADKEPAYGVIDDFLKEYEIAARADDATDKCWRAGLVAAAYLEAHDEIGYRKWKVVQKADCEEMARG
jgi:hypothetical protein